MPRFVQYYEINTACVVIFTYIYLLLWELNEQKYMT